MGLNACYVVVALLTLSLLANGEWKGDSLPVNNGDDIVGGLYLGETRTGNAAFDSELDLGLRKDKLQLNVVGSNVLG